ncbi:DUF1289 domain-containing protein [Rudaea sp.]|uniref:DUF1289 domain-containing protein n=1 Tax=Rudaea sp. TaxID=2136325 RepID=UPI002ED56EEF
MFFRKPPPKPILTPCIGVCVLDATGHCEGCHRTIDEIANWGMLGDAERVRLMDDVLPKRAEQRSPPA